MSDSSIALILFRCRGDSDSLLFYEESQEMTSQEIKACTPGSAQERWLKEIAYQLAASNEISRIAVDHFGTLRTLPDLIAKFTEEAKQRHEENLQQRDAFLLDDPPVGKRCKDGTHHFGRYPTLDSRCVNCNVSILELADSEPSKANPFGECGEWHQGEALEIAEELLNTIGHSSSRERDKRAIALEMQQYALRFALAHQKPDAEQERVNMIRQEYAVLEESRKRTIATLRLAAQTIQECNLDRQKAVDYLLKYAEAFESAVDHGENLNPHLTRVDSADITCPNCCRPFWVHVSMVGPWNPPKKPADNPVAQPAWTAGGSIKGTE